MIQLSRRDFILSSLAAGISACQPRSEAGALWTPWLGVNVAAFEPLLFDISANDHVLLTYRLLHEAEVIVMIADALNRPFRSLACGHQQAGLHTIAWDGRDDQGRLAPDEVYTWRVTAQRGQTLETLDALNPGGQTVKIAEHSLNRKDGTLRYDLPQAARVRLRLGLRGGALLRTLLDWIPQPAGPQTILWDGQDADGVMNLLAHPDLAYDLAAFALPDQAMIVTGNPPAPGVLPFLDLPPLHLQMSQSTAAPSSERHPHALHWRTACHEPRCAITFPTATRTTPEGWPIVQGVVPLQVDVAAQDRVLVVAAQFEIYIFVDIVLFGEFVGNTLPYNHRWDTTGLNPGPHVLTINLKTAEDHIGMRSVVVLVKK